MSALFPNLSPNGNDPAARGPLPVQPGTAATDIAIGLQLCRASAMSLMRLQLAFERGDRLGAMEAIDRLHALDSEAEQMMEGLPLRTDDPVGAAIARHLKEEKMAVAFEKLALASGVSGPKLGAPPAFLCQDQASSPPEFDEPDLEDGAPPVDAAWLEALRAHGFKAALLLAIAAGASVLVMAAM